MVKSVAQIGKVLNEGKTKVIRELNGGDDDESGRVLIISKDRITAGDGARANDMEGKAAVSNRTASLVFQFLQSVGVKNHYVEAYDDVSFVARHCHMVPIEFVARRLATGSFLKRNPGVPEGHVFAPIKLETFFKDDANHDPQWSSEQILTATKPDSKEPLFEYDTETGPVTINADLLSIMLNQTRTIFEILEHAWRSRGCVLVDMKIEFGVDVETGEILLADMIDSDSWRLWPGGDKRLMKDKQVYRNLETVKAEDLQLVLKNFKWIEEELKQVAGHQSNCRAVIMMGSPTDEDHCSKIAKALEQFGIQTRLQVSSAHKATEDTLRMIATLEAENIPTVFVAVAGRSNGLGPVSAGYLRSPVINCPPPSEQINLDAWSSLRLPSGLGCSTVLDPDNCALAVANIFALSDFKVWASVAAKQLNQTTANVLANKKFAAAVGGGKNGEKH